jgi:hypothetical protein
LFSNVTVTFDEKVSNRNAEVRSEVESVASDPHHGVQEDRTAEFSFLGTTDTQPPCISLLLFQRGASRVHTFGALAEGHNSRACISFSSHCEMSCVLAENYRVDADRRCFLIVSGRDQ